MLTVQEVRRICETLENEQPIFVEKDGVLFELGGIRIIRVGTGDGWTYAAALVDMQENTVTEQEI